MALTVISQKQIHFRTDTPLVVYEFTRLQTNLSSKGAALSSDKGMPHSGHTRYIRPGTVWSLSDRSCRILEPCYPRSLNRPVSRIAWLLTIACCGNRVVRIECRAPGDVDPDVVAHFSLALTVLFWRSLGFLSTSPQNYLQYFCFMTFIAFSVLTCPSLVNVTFFLIWTMVSFCQFFAAVRRSYAEVVGIDA